MFPNIDRIGEDGQKICAFFAVTSGAGFAVQVVKIPRVKAVHDGTQGRGHLDGGPQTRAARDP